MSLTRTATRAPTIPAPAPPRRQRAAICLYFICAGIVMAVWGARLPSVQARLHLGPGALSVGLLCAAAGMVAGLQLGGRIADRMGAERLVRPASLALAGALALLGLPSSFGPFLISCVVFGTCHGLLDVSMNVTAAQCQIAYRRPILQSIHATYSLGALAGALIAALTARAAVSAPTTFALTAAFLAVATVAAPPLTKLHTPATTTNVGSTPARTAAPASSRVIALLGVLALCSLMNEGAAGDWSAVHLHSVLHASTSLSASAYACYSAAMATCRLCGDRISHWLGPVRLVRIGGLIAATGLGLGLLIPYPAAALAGWTLLGAGLAGVVPATVTAASTARPYRAGRDVALISATGYLGMLAGPALIGAIAAATNLTIALALPALLALGVAVAAGAVRPTTIPKETHR